MRGDEERATTGQAGGLETKLRSAFGETVKYASGDDA